MLTHIFAYVKTFFENHSVLIKIYDIKNSAIKNAAEFTNATLQQQT